jgi:hypothetical protein
MKTLPLILLGLAGTSASRPQLKANPPVRFKRPPYPGYKQRLRATP